MMRGNGKNGQAARLIAMRVGALGCDPCSGLPVVVLHEVEGDRRLPIWIGRNEAQAIAVQLEGVELARPMTHDLLHGVLDALGACVQRVVVTELRDDTYYARIEVAGCGAAHALDARPSDAIAVALRARAPILVDARVLAASTAPQLQAPEACATEPERIRRFLENLSADAFGKWKM